MRVRPAAMRLNLSSNALASRLSYIYKRTQLDPRKFYDLVQLMQIIEGDDDV